MNLCFSEADLYLPSFHCTTIVFETIITIFCPENHRLIEEAHAEATKRVITLTGSSLDTCSPEKLAIFHVFRSFLKTIRFSDIGLIDLIHPTSRRVIPTYNAVFDYALYCYPRWGYIPRAEKIKIEGDYATGLFIDSDTLSDEEDEISYEEYQVTESQILPAPDDDTVVDQSRAEVLSGFPRQ
ncbi:hypothetical protein MFLAVUS_008042 [Mucor flavus]|uniref:Kinetochore protein Nuf2 N-terminal domain-containing protein n=1 Tax=Mucor flavus TaxID=439312 RepID=A0ABP9Z5Y7_9FUNG